ncbi:MAG: AAA family ATPase, partial [Lachnospiraceae bacterium]|nr:AAA family ATPase [Lachnospiraceae bacterium]
MLTHLHVKNLAIVEDIEIDFGEKLNILTGETGVGKSVIVGSINIALGAKISSDMVRTDADYALVEMIFEIDEYEEQLLGELDIHPEDGMLIISRKITGGRSVSKINGETVTLGVLKKAAGKLIDIHGQHEHQ